MTKALIGLFSLAAIVIIGAAGLLYYSYSHDTNTVAMMGQRADFFGGFTNPLLTFLTFVGVLITISLQRQELKETRIEIRRQADALETQLLAIAKQNFEATLFQMLSLHNDIVNSLTATDGNGKAVNGRAAFAEIFRRLSRHYANPPPQYPQTHQRIGNIYADIYDNNRHLLGHYFRIIFNIVRFIDEKCPVEAGTLPTIAKMTYVRIVRAQLSDAELVLMFYNATVGMGANFLPYIRDFDLLDNLDDNMLLDNADRALLVTIRP